MWKDIRQLAAVMFTDMVGYTALMQTDEHQAKQHRDRQRKVLEKLILRKSTDIIFIKPNFC